MNKGYAFGFILVILVLVLGFYVAYTGFVSTRETLRAGSASLLETEVGQVTRNPTLSLALATPITATAPAPLPGITATLTAAAAPEAPVAPDAASPAATSGPQPTNPPAATPVQVPTLPPAQASATPEVVQPPTPVPVPAYQFRVGGPPSPDPSYPNCCYIYGTVRDAAGNGLEGVLVQVSNEWNELPAAVTKGGAEAGKFDITLGHETVTWEMVIIDAGGGQVSTKVTIPFDPDVANGYRVDWKRTY